jgi:hypothetical protein
MLPIWCSLSIIILVTQCLFTILLYDGMVVILLTIKLHLHMFHSNVNVNFEMSKLYILIDNISYWQILNIISKNSG